MSFWPAFYGMPRIQKGQQEGPEGHQESISYFQLLPSHIQLLPSHLQLFPSHRGLVFSCLVTHKNTSFLNATANWKLEVECVGILINEQLSLALSLTKILAFQMQLHIEIWAICHIWNTCNILFTVLKYMNIFILYLKTLTWPGEYQMVPMKTSQCTYFHWSVHILKLKTLIYFRYS